VRHAQESAQTYADKYIHLRQEYESHVQRLMYKLTQEQQARTQVEDKLEEALVSDYKIYSYTYYIINS
jgi:hypothetical protein